MIGSLTFISLSYFISKTRCVHIALTKWSENTIFITGTHLVEQYGPASRCVGWTYPLWQTNTFTFLTIGAAFAMLMLYLPICYLIDNYLPFISGKELKLFKKNEDLSHS